MKKQIISEEFLKFQKLAGLITETEFKEKVKEAEEAEASKVKFTIQSSFPKDEATAKAAVAQLQSGDPNASILKASDKPIDANKAKAWVEKIGPEEVVKRILDIANKIPSSGLAKKDMPFLPGPDDAVGSVEDVEDALTPGGKYNVDFKEAIEPPAPNALGKVDSDEKAKAFMTSGTKDGKPEDDKATFKANPNIAASAAVPTQTNILLGKSLSMAIGGVKGGPLGAYISTDNEILDGHHRWAATMLNDPGASIGGFGAIDLNAMGGRTKALKYLTAIGNALGNKTKTQENINITKLVNEKLTKYRLAKENKDVKEGLFGFLKKKKAEAPPPSSGPKIIGVDWDGRYIDEDGNIVG